MKFRLLSILLLFVFSPVSFAVQTPSSAAQKPQKILEVRKTEKTPQTKTPQKISVEPKLSSTVKKIDKKLTVVSAKTPKSSNKSVLSKTKKQISTGITKMEAPSARKNLFPSVNKTDKASSFKPPKKIPEIINEIPVKTKKNTTVPFSIKNAPPAAKPSAIEGTDLRKIAKEASLELKEEEVSVLGDLRILWQYAVENSETIKFAIYKLSDPKGDIKKADESKIKKLLKPISGITPFVAATATNPIAAGSSIIGGTFMNDVLSDDKYRNHLEKVTDADLVILAKAIEDLQNNLVTAYYEYIISKKILTYADVNLQNRKKLCDSLIEAPEETVVIADTFYREALARQNQAQANLLLKRAALEQLVGNDAILVIENNKKQSKIDPTP